MERHEVGRRNGRHPLYHYVRQFALEFNLFESDAIDHEAITIQRWSSRVYLVLLLLGMSILLGYNATRIETYQYKVNHPSLGRYIELQQLYGTSLNCPCTRISASTNSFVKLIVEYHDICASEFVSQEWIDLLFDNTTSMLYAVDIRATASNQFQVVRELCIWLKTAISNSIQSFYTEQLVSGNLLSEKLFMAQVDAMVQDFLTGTFTYILQYISFFRSFTLGNEMMSGIQTPYTMLIYTDDNVNWNPDIQVNFYEEGNGASQRCTCDVNATCRFPAAFYDVQIVDNYGKLSGSAFNASFILENWFVGCWALEALLLSSLENSFLTNQSMLNKFITYFNFTSNSTPIALNDSITTSKPNTFNDLLQTLFVKQLSPVLNYSAYFAQCQPQACIYTITQRPNFLYIFTALLGFYGGLSTVLRFLVPHVIIFLSRFRKRIMPPDSSDDNSSDNTGITATTWRQHASTMMRKLWHSLVNLNLFKSLRQQQPSDIKQQCWTTRLYIVLLASGVIILTFYLLLRHGGKSIQVTKPPLSVVEDLQQSQSAGLISSLQCPCTQLTIPYGEFVHLQPFYHQVCSSDFVSLRWVDAVAHTINPVSTGDYYLDFHNTAPLFQLLKSMCDFSNETVMNSLQTFEQNPLVTAELLNVDLFENQTLSAISQFKVETINKFLHFLQIMRNYTYINQILTGSFDNFNCQIAPSPSHAAALSIWYYSISDGNLSSSCSCANNPGCKTTTGIYTGYHGAWIVHYIVPGLYTACFPVESLLQSTLECFYNDQGCLTFLIDYYNASFFSNFTQLNSSSSASHFATNSTIGTLLGELFIEYWSGSPNYSAYFDQCQPASCSYEISGADTVTEAVTRIIALIGGLSAALHILTPMLVSICVGLTRRALRHHQVPNESVSLRLRFMTFYKNIRAWLQDLNAFEDINHTRNIEHQRFSTRLYFLLLCISLSILVGYTSVAYSVITFTVQNPSLDQFQQLQQQYGSDALNCPCSHLSITYSSFVNIKCNFHEVCTSQFVSDSYLQELFILYNELDTLQSAANAYTVQGTIFTHFQALFILCNLAQDAVNDARQQFLDSSFVSATMLDFALFDQETNSSLANFVSTLPNSFSNALQLIRSMTQANGLVSGYATNWYPVPYNLQELATVYLHPQYYGDNNCNCATSSTCTQSSTPFFQGYLVGCTPLEALLYSTIECLYDYSCIDDLAVYLNTTQQSSIPLDKNQTRFSPNDTVDSIVQQMFIETCSPNISYQQFFDECRPLYCSVTLTERNSFIIVFTTLVGLYGGLTTFLRFMVPTLLTWIFKLVALCKRRGAQIQVEPIVHNGP